MAFLEKPDKTIWVAMTNQIFYVKITKSNKLHSDVIRITLRPRSMEMFNVGFKEVSKVKNICKVLFYSSAKFNLKF